MGLQVYLTVFKIFLEFLVSPILLITMSCWFYLTYEKYLTFFYHHSCSGSSLCPIWIIAITNNTADTLHSVFFSHSHTMSNIFCITIRLNFVRHKVRVTEELTFKFYLILINLNLNLKTEAVSNIFPSLTTLFW